MDSLGVEESRLEDRAGSPNLAGLPAQVFLGLFLSVLALVGIAYWLGTPAFAKGQWAGAALLGLAAMSTLISLARQLPWQNVVLSAVLIAFAGAAVEAVWSSIGSGTGSFRAGRPAEQLFLLSCQWSLVWLVSMLNGRGVVRLVLRRWRLESSYGFWVLGGTVLLAVLFLVSFASLSLVQLDWVKLVPGSTLGTLVALVLVTPSLINKKPVTAKVDWHPLVIWVAFNLWFVVEAARQGRWIVAGLILSEILAVVLFTARAHKIITARGHSTRTSVVREGQPAITQRFNVGCANVTAQKSRRTAELE